MGNKKNKKKKKSQNSNGKKKEGEGRQDFEFDIDLELGEEEEGEGVPPSYDVLDSVNDMDEMEKGTGGELNTNINTADDVARDIMARYKIGESDNDHTDLVKKSSAEKDDKLSTPCDDEVEENTKVPMDVEVVEEDTLLNDKNSMKKVDEEKDISPDIMEDVRKLDVSVEDARDDAKENDEGDAMFQQEFREEEVTKEYHAEKKSDDGDHCDVKREDVLELKGVPQIDEMDLLVDNSWMTGLRSKELIQEAEVLICRHMLLDPSFSCSPLWRDVVDISPGENLRSSILSCHSQKGGMASLQNFAELWKVRCGVILPGDVLSAILVRCGTRYKDLENNVQDILTVSNTELKEIQSKLLGSDRNSVLDKALNSFSGKKLADIESFESCQFDLNALKSMLWQYEILFHIWVVQMSRIQPYIDERKKEEREKSNAQSSSFGASTKSSVNETNKVPGCIDKEELFFLATKRLGMLSLTMAQTELFALLMLSPSLPISSEVGFCSVKAAVHTNDNYLVLLLDRCKLQCKIVSSFPARFKDYIESFLSPQRRPVSYLDDVQTDGFGGLKSNFPPSLLSIFAGDLALYENGVVKGKDSFIPDAGQPKITTIGTKTLCNYLVDSYDGEVSGDFLCGCCYIWSGGNFDVFFDEEDPGIDKKLFNFQGGVQKHSSGTSDTSATSKENTRRLTDIVLRSCRGLSFDSHLDRTSTIQQDTLAKFFYPFNISIRETSPLGRIVYRNKFHPLEYTDQMYNQLRNKFFLKFRKNFSSEKAPADVRMYKCTKDGAKAFEIEKPNGANTPVLIADICGDEDHICLESAYVIQVLEKNEKRKNMQIGDNMNKNKTDDIENRPPPSNARELVERLANPPTVHVKAPKPFPFAYGTVPAWGIATMVKYLQQVMELPQYEESFLQFEMNGYSFICLDINTATKVCAAAGLSSDKKNNEPEKKIDHDKTFFSAGQLALHAAKLSCHAENLRTCAFHDALENIPVVLDEYHPIHVASLLDASVACGGGDAPNSALHSLRKQISGEKLIALQPEGIAKICTKFDCDGDEINHTIQFLVDLLKKHTNLNTLSVPSIRDSSSLRDIADKRIHISTFDKVADAAEAKRINTHIEKGGDNKKKETAIAKKRRKKREKNAAPAIKSEEEMIVTETPAVDIDVDKLNDSLPEDVMHLSPVMEENDEDFSGGVEDGSIEDPLLHENSTNKIEKKRQAEANIQLAQELARSSALDKSRHEAMLVEQNKQFMKQMSSVQNMLKEHTGLIKSLKRQNDALRKENKEADQKIRLANEVTKEQEIYHKRTLEMALEQRNVAAQTLTLVSDQYLSDLKSQVQKRDVTSMSDVYVPPKYPDLEQPPDFQEDDTPDIYENGQLTQHQNFPSSPKWKISSSMEPLEQVVAHGHPSPSQLEQMETMHESPLRAARKTSESTANIQKKELDTGTNPDIVGQMAKDAEYEIHQWKKLLKVYKFSQQPFDLAEYDDIDALIRRLALLWCRLGKVMYDDAAGRSPDKSPSYVLSPLLTGLLETVTKAVDEALKVDEDVMESTVHNFLSESSEGARLSTEASRRQHCRVAARRKKLTREHISKMPFISPIENIEPRRYSIYVGLVFALAVVYKLINKFDSKSDQVNLMYLLQRLRNGDDTCFKDLSRDDLRGFLADHLYVVFSKKWHKYDALCQRFDPDKKGIITHTQVQKSFRWMCPLASLMGDVFDGQVAIQTLLSMVSLQVLSCKMEFTSLMKKLLVQYKSTIPSFENFVNQRSLFSNRPPHDLRFNCDALLIADILYLLATQYLGIEFDEGHYDNNSNRENAWKLPECVTSSSGAPIIETLKYSGLSSSLSTILAALLQRNDILYGVKFTLMNLRSACFKIAKGLLLYDYSKLSRVTEDSNSGSIAVSGLSTLLSTYSAFWHHTLKLKQSITTYHGDHVNSSASLPQHDDLDIVVDSVKFSSSLVTLLGDNKKAEMILKRIGTMRIDNLEVMISELVGAPVLSHCLELPLVAVQANISPHILKTKGLFSSHEFQRSKSATQIRDFQSSKIKIEGLGGSDYEGILPPSPIMPSPTQLQRWDTKSKRRLAKTSQGNAIISENDDDNDDGNEFANLAWQEDRNYKPSAKLTRLQEDSKELQDKHRLEQVTMYSKELERKLEGRKNILSGLLQLLRSCQSPNRKNNILSMMYGENDGAKEIKTKMKNLQKRLLKEMQKKRSTKMELLENHVNELKKKILQEGSTGARFANQNESDPLVKILRHVVAIEADILQTNSDALLIIDNISGILSHMES